MAESVGERVLNDLGQVVVDLFGIDLTPDAASDDEPVVKPTSPVASADSHLAIPQYDSQAAAQIVKLLSQLTPEEREEIAVHEAAGRNRVTILRKIEQLRDK